MAADGPGILESDLAHDVYNEILDLYDAGVEVPEIRDRLSSDYENDDLDDMEMEIYLAAAARALWEIGHLDEELGLRLARLVQSGKSIAIWERAADPAFAQERKAVLARFLRQISGPRKTPRGRKKYARVKTKLFALGDCVALEADGQMHRGVVCRITEHRGECDYAILVMERQTESTVESFLSGKYFGRRIPSSLLDSGFELGPHVIRPAHHMLRRAGNPFAVIGHIELDPSKFVLGSFGGVMDVADVVEEFVTTEKNAAAFGRELLPLRDLVRT